MEVPRSGLVSSQAIRYSFPSTNTLHCWPACAHSDPSSGPKQRIEKLAQEAGVRIVKDIAAAHT